MRAYQVCFTLVLAGLATGGCLAAGEGENRHPERKAVRVLLKAPYHTCVIKRLPEMRAFINDHAPHYPLVDVKPYSQPPNFVIYFSDGTNEKHVVKDHTVDEMVALLHSFGVEPGLTEGKPNAPTADPPCADEL